MDALLSHAFDNISSKDVGRIRKGLRQIEGLLAQICLSAAPSRRPAQEQHRRGHARQRSTVAAHAASEPKRLADVGADLAFREFYRLQDGFEWNVSTKLVSCLERLLGMGAGGCFTLESPARGRLLMATLDGSHDLVLLSTLDLLQGVLLLHHPSRRIFVREIHLNLLLDLLDTSNPPAIQSSTLLVLVTALLAHPANIRTFEAIDGLLVVTSLFKARNTARDVKLKTIEFLYFYLMPESTSVSMSGAPAVSDDFMKAPLTPSGLQRSPSKVLSALERSHAWNRNAGEKKDAGRLAARTKSTEEKQAMLGRYLTNVEELVRDLRENAPFGLLAT